MLALSSAGKGLRRYIAPVSVVTVIVTLGIFWYVNFYDVPKLSYEVLESYPLSDNEQITLIIFRNTGHSSATNVVINIKSNGFIQDYKFNSPEEINFYTISNKELRAKMERFVHGIKVSLYVNTLMSIDTPFSEITITYDQGVGKEFINIEAIYTDEIEIIVFIIGLIILIFTLYYSWRKLLGGIFITPHKRDIKNNDSG